MKINYHRDDHDDIWALIFKSFILKLTFKQLRDWDWKFKVDTLALYDQYNENSWKLKNPYWGFTEKFFYFPTMTIMVQPSRVKELT